MEEFQHLTKRERRQLKKNLEEQQRQKLQKRKKYSKIILLVISFLIIISLIFWLQKISSRPQIGISYEDQGREHIPSGEKFSYNTNPPTSGSHYEDWIKAGIYDDIPPDEKLVHSLEHGYVIISYNCDFPKRDNIGLIQKVLAHEESEATPAGDIKDHLEFNQWKNNQECQKLISDLTGFAQKMRIWKLIVVPRPTLDARFALTAWGRLDKFSYDDEERMKAFIDSNRDHGPEKTME